MSEKLSREQDLRVLLESGDFDGGHALIIKDDFWREKIMGWKADSDRLKGLEDALIRLEGGVVCLAHASMVSGDTETCERVEGDLPPYLDDDEQMCGPFADVFYQPLSVEGDHD